MANEKATVEYTHKRLNFPAYTPEPHKYTRTPHEAARPKVSVIMVMWNNLELNKKCLNSIHKYSNDYELILVDNASTDGTKEWLLDVVREWKGEETVKLVTLEKNGGWPKGVNAGMRYAEGTHVLWMNNDIEVTEGWLEKLTAHLVFEDEVGIVGPTTNFVMGYQKADMNQFFNKLGNHHEVPYLIGFCMLVKDTCLQAVGGWIDEDFWDTAAGSGSADDIDYCMRATAAGFKLVICRDTYVTHHGSKSFEIIFGKDLYQKGTEANKNYMGDVDKFLKQLRKKWGEDKVKTAMTLPPLPDTSRGTIGIPHGDFIPAETVHSLMQMKIPNDVSLVFNYGSGVAKARNNIVDQMTGEWLIFIDSDMTFPEDAIIKMVANLEDPNVDICTAICYRKVPNFEPCIFKKAAGNNPEYHFIGDWPKDRLFEIDACGSAFIGIKRSVFDAMSKPHYSYSDFLSEDLNFCRRAKDYGFRIWADPSIPVGHMKGFPFGESVYRRSPANGKMIANAPQLWPEIWNYGIKKEPTENAKMLENLSERAKATVITDDKE